MKFYRENKVNPFASCLPLVAQLPVFLSLFYMLRKDLRHDICPDVNPPGTAEPGAVRRRRRGAVPLHPGPDGQGDGRRAGRLIVLYVGSQLLSTLLMSTATDRTQRMIFLALPFFFVIFVINFPAGLLVYWITTNLWTIVQQAIVRKRLGPMRPPGARRRADVDLDRHLHGRRSPTAAPAPLRRRSERRRRRTRSPARAPARARKAASRAEARAGRPRRRRRRARRRSDRETPMSDATQPSSADRVRELLEQRQRRARPRRRGRGRRRTATRSAACSTATTSGCSSAATARRSTPSSTSPSRSPRAASRRRRKVEVDAAGLPRAPRAGAERQADQAAADAVRSDARSPWTR